MKKIIIMKGDGVGPEVTDQGIKLLRIIRDNHLPLELIGYPVGGESIEKFGVNMTDHSLDECRDADAVYFGAVGHPRYDSLPLEQRPTWALARLRTELGLYANLRPIKINKNLVDRSNLKKDTIKDVDIMFVRELTEGIYFTKPKKNDGKKAIDTMRYSRNTIEKISKLAYSIAVTRKKHITSVDKSNALCCSQLWRDAVSSYFDSISQIKLDHMLVDNFAMQLILDPGKFDIVMTSNLMGDILTDQAAALTGSIGMIPSASLNPEEKHALYEPMHGSAPDIERKDIANPLASILSLAMMMEFSFNNKTLKDQIESSVNNILKKGFRTKDIHSSGKKLVSCSSMGEMVSAEFQKVTA